MSNATDAPEVGDLVVATFRPQWENKGGKPYTITDTVWRTWLPHHDAPLMVGPTPLAGALSVEVVERAS